jgi:adapter protein MecA 1/2
MVRRERNHMEIERINENTVKFFISYVDVEERGFDREEIWYNREKSEQLFWEMMDEVHDDEDFPFDGPLWIQVQALEKGLEVVVTKAQITKDGARFDFPLNDEKYNNYRLNEQVEDLLHHHFSYDDHDLDHNIDEETSISFVTYFTDFEDLISLSTRPWPEKLQTKLYSYEGKYFLYLNFPFDAFTEEEIDDLLSVVLEYGTESQRTIHFLQEYGKEVIAEDVFTTVNKYFK